MRQELVDYKHEIIEQKAGGLAQGTDDRPLFRGGFPVQLVRPGAAILAVLGCAFTLLRMVSVLTLKRWASTPVGSDERAISWRTAGVVRACG